MLLLLRSLLQPVGVEPPVEPPQVGGGVSPVRPKSLGWTYHAIPRRRTRKRRQADILLM